MRNKILIYALFSSILLYGFQAQAASLFFEPQELTAGTGKEFTISVNLNAASAINALQVAIRVPENLKPLDISNGNSIVSFWLGKPDFDPVSRILTFSGIIPGGFKGKDARVLLMKFVPEKEGEAVLSFDSEYTKIYLNTPYGIEDKLSLNNLSLPISKNKENLAPLIGDDEPPESFVPEISRDDNLFEGKYFLVFSTTDKNSGIDHYEVREGIAGEFIKAESPYVLKEQLLRKQIFVKAVDKAGNERTAVIQPKDPESSAKSWPVFTIIIMVVVMAWFLYRKKAFGKFKF